MLVGRVDPDLLGRSMGVTAGVCQLVFDVTHEVSEEGNRLKSRSGLRPIARERVVFCCTPL